MGKPIKLINEVKSLPIRFKNSIENAKPTKAKRSKK